MHFSCCDPQGRQEWDMRSSHPLWLVLQPGRWRKSWHLNRQCAVSRIQIVSASCLSRKHRGPPSSQLSPLQNLKLNFQSASLRLIQNGSRLHFVTLKRQMTISAMGHLLNIPWNKRVWRPQNNVSERINRQKHLSIYNEVRNIIV